MARSAVVMRSIPSAARIAGEQATDALAGGVTGGDDVGAVDRHVADAGGEVRGQRQAEDLHPHVAGGDRLQHGRHADEVAAHRAGHADLGGGLEVGPVEADVDALREVGLDGPGDVAEAGAVEVGEVDEPGARTAPAGWRRSAASDRSG